MVDNVEDILREIAERVRAEQPKTHSGENPVAVATNPATLSLSEAPQSSHFQMDSYLTTTARAWDRLPPVVSNRKGAAAKLELLIKRFFKRLTHWYTWEQVNFNASVHSALKQTSNELADVILQIRELREQLLAEQNSRQFFQTDLKANLQEDLKATRNELGALNSHLELHTREIAAHQEFLQGQQDQLKDQTENLAALTSRLLELTTEMRQASEAISDEQRVSFKQLLLEISELATLVDRSKRQLQTRLEKLEAHMEK